MTLGDTFTELATSYLTSGLTKGIPSLFADVKSLYHDDAKRLVIEQIVETAREHFQPGETAHWLGPATCS
jgi:hypothetical protein